MPGVHIISIYYSASTVSRRDFMKNTTTSTTTTITIIIARDKLYL